MQFDSAKASPEAISAFDYISMTENIEGIISPNGFRAYRGTNSGLAGAPQRTLLASYYFTATAGDDSLAVDTVHHSGGNHFSSTGLSYTPRWGGAKVYRDYSYFRIHVTSPHSGAKASLLSWLYIGWFKGAGIGNCKIEISTDAGLNWQTIESNTQSTSGEWRVQAALSNQALIRVSDIDNPSRSDLSDGYFSIYLNIWDLFFPPPVPSCRLFCDRILSGSKVIFGGGTSTGGVKPVSKSIPMNKVLTDADSLANYDFLLVRDSGEVQLMSILPDGTIDSVPRQVLVFDSVITGVAIADYNNDGLVDIAVAHTHGNAVSLQFGTPDGLFDTTSTHQLPLGELPGQILSDDFNRDGNQDLAVALQTNLAVVYFGNGDGTFAPPDSTQVLDGNITALATADFNGDNIPDLSIACGDSGDVWVLTGSGDGHFLGSPVRSLGSSVSSLLAFDVDQENGPDLTAGFDSLRADLIVLRNTGMGTFDTLSTDVRLQGHRSIVAGDLNGDGIVDLSVASALQDSIVTVTGFVSDSGEFGFCCPTVAPAGENPIALMISDFNNDGIPDLVALNRESDDLSSFPGQIAPSVSTSLSITSPNGGDHLGIDSTTTITWTKGQGVIAVGIQLSRDADSTWETIAHNVTGDSYSWLVTAPMTNTARIRIYDETVPTRSDTSDALFSIGENCCVDIRGDVNGDGALDITDLIFMVDYSFANGQAPVCEEEADVNGDGTVDITDLVYLVDYSFSSGPAPVPCP
jgi:hypothetical protein